MRKKKAATRDKFVDALQGEHHYAVLTKGRRVQILVCPTIKQLRKRGWELAEALGGEGGGEQALLEAVRRAVREAEGRDDPAGGGQVGVA